MGIRRIVAIAMLRIRSLVGGGALDADVREELRDHLARQVDVYLAEGRPPAEAHRLARRDLGNLPQLEEACRDARGVRWWDDLRLDVRYALRQMSWQPHYSALAMLTAALGTAVCLTVFGVVDAVLLRPLDFPAAHQLYSLYEVSSRDNVGRTRTAPLNFLDWRAAATAFDGMAAHAGTGFTLTGNGDPEFVVGQLVTPNFLDVLRVRPALGRGFRADEAEAGHNRVVILTDRLWRRSFNADPAVIGRVSTINGRPYQIVGVLPPSFHYPSDRYQLLTPLVTRGTEPGAPPMTRNARYLSVVARLAAGTSPDAARDQLAGIASELSRRYADADAEVSIGMTELTADIVGAARAGLVLALTAVGLVLLVAGINLAGLAIARGSARSRELSVRLAIGASPLRLVRQLAMEGIVLFAAGGAVGMLLAAAVLTVFRSRLPASLPRAAEIAVDWRFAGSGAVIVLAAAVLFSVVPALSVARWRRARELTTSRPAEAAARATQRVRGGLIAAQIAVATILVITAALAFRSLERVVRVDTGFDPAAAMTFDVVMPDERYPAGRDIRQFTDRVWRSLEVVPGVEAVGTTTALPLSDQNLENSFTVEGSPTTPGAEPPVAALRGVTGHYLEAIGARLVRGRGLRPSDTAEAPAVVVVTSDFAARYIASVDPIGVRVKLGGSDSDDPWRRVVGVIASIRHTALDQPPRPEVWLPLAQMPDDFLTAWARGVYVAARTSIDPPEAAMPGLRAAMRAIDPQMPLVEVQSLTELTQHSLAQRRLETSLLGAFGAVTLILSAVGLFGVVTLYVTQRTREFGVRLALGASRRDLLRLVLRRSASLLLAGLAIGLPGAVAIGQGMSHLLYGVTPTDPVALGASVVLLAVATGLASLWPARRATRIDPLIALRHD